MDSHQGMQGAQPPSTAPGAFDLVESYSRAVVQCFAVYYALAAFLHFVLPAVLPMHRIQERQKAEHTVRDALRSAPPLLIKAATLCAGEWLHRSGYGCLTDESLYQALFNVRRVAALGVLLVLMDLFHDTWFYFAHRWLHTPWLLRKVHYVHHQSHQPSAFTGYSFHWIEACMVFSVAIAEIFIFPVPLALQRFYELYMMAIHIGGHCGYEMAPFVPHLVQVIGGTVMGLLRRGGYKGGELSSLVNNVEHHDMHHKYVRYHFSLYYTHWDYLGGTMHPEYMKNHKRSF